MPLKLVTFEEEGVQAKEGEDDAGAKSKKYRRFHSKTSRIVKF